MKRTAASKLSTAMSGRIGPKISSRISGESGSTLFITVGSICSVSAS